MQAVSADNTTATTGNVRSTKDKSYRAFPLGELGGRFLRAKRGQFTTATYNTYETMLDKLARYFPEHDISDLEPPEGRELLAQFLDETWGGAKARTFNKNLSMVKEFFKWLRLQDLMVGDPTIALERHKARDVARETFSEDDCELIIEAQPSRRDRIALRLLLNFGLRKSSLRAVQYKHFDHEKRWLQVFSKGEKINWLPLPDPELWDELEAWEVEAGVDPQEYLLNRRHQTPVYLSTSASKKKGKAPDRYHVTEYRDQPMGVHGAHDWWYQCLERAGLVAQGQRSGERMHKARHTAGQRVMDKTRGNVKAVQKMLGHADPETTLRTYVDWENYQLEDVLTDIFESD